MFLKVCAPVSPRGGEWRHHVRFGRGPKRSYILQSRGLGWLPRAGRGEVRPGAILDPRAGLVAAWLSYPGPYHPSAPRPGAQPRREAAVRCPTSAAPLPHRDNPLPEAPQRRVRRPAAAPEEDVVGGVEREEAVHGDENRAETLPRQPHPT